MLAFFTAGSLLDNLEEAGSRPIGDLLYMAMLNTSTWGLGRVVRRWREQARLLTQRTAELEQERRAQAAVVEERNRIARELHDIIAHSVSLMVVQAAAAEQMLAGRTRTGRRADRPHPDRRRPDEWHVRTLSGHCRVANVSDPAVRPPRRHRLEVRVTPEQDALIRQAADLEDTTVTTFVLDTVTSNARRVVKQHRDLVLSNDAFDRFIAELDTPPKPVPELVELFKKNPKLREV